MVLKTGGIQTMLLVHCIKNCKKDFRQEQMKNTKLNKIIQAFEGYYLINNGMLYKLLL